MENPKTEPEPAHDDRALFLERCPSCQTVLYTVHESSVVFTQRLTASSPGEVFALVRDLQGARKERLVGLYLDAQSRVIQRETLSVGALNTTSTHPSEIARPAIVHSALGVILAHNHPSGSLDPSRDDIEFTRTVARGLELLGIKLVDHLIVSSRGFVSLKERGLI